MNRLALLACIAVACSAAGKSRYSSNASVFWSIPEALRLIRTADEVYILPVTLTKDRDGVLTPHGNFRRLRPLSVDARSELSRLLGKEDNWLHGADNTISIDWPRKQAGFVFRNEREKLVLLCGLGWRLEGTFNGETTDGSLEEKAFYKLDKWKQQYAKPELGIK
jgi:hypothetical protein